MDNGDDDIPAHPTCLFWATRFFGPDELQRHLDDNHFTCNLWEGGKNLYYASYELLKQHFQKAHYLCPDPVCLEQMFIVFRTPYDLNLHHMNVHTQFSSQKKVKAQPMPLMREHSRNLPNTEAVDFTLQFS